MFFKKTSLLFLVISSFLFLQVNADNKTDLIWEIDTIESNLNSLKKDSIYSLEKKVQELLDKYDNAFVDLWYDEKKVSYLFSLWKITSNFKDDLVKELSDLKAEILSKINLELSSLWNVKDDVNFKYKTISDSEKNVFDSKLTSIKSNYNSLKDTFSQKEALLISKYTSSLNDYIDNVKRLYDENISSLDMISKFDTKYEELYSLFLDFEKNYEIFKSDFLSYAWDLTKFSEEKQKEYVKLLRGVLEKAKNLNLEANKDLEKFKLDIDRFIDILVENFENSLKIKIWDSYWLIYSSQDLDNLILRFKSIKNRFFDSDWKIKAKTVIDTNWAIEELDFLKEKIDEINVKIKYLIWDEGTSRDIDNIKIRLENEMIRFYNSSYPKFREDLLVKLKEKLNILSLETKNILLASDAINIRFDLLSQRINKLNNIDDINKEINNFYKEVEKYYLLKNEILDKKIDSLKLNLKIFVTKKELSQAKYRKYKDNYTEKLQEILSNLKSKFPSSYKQKLDKLLEKVDWMLKEDIKDKTRYILLIVKLEALKALKE